MVFVGGGSSVAEQAVKVAKAWFCEEGVEGSGCEVIWHGKKGDNGVVALAEPDEGERKEPEDEVEVIVFGGFEDSSD